MLSPLAAPLPLNPAEHGLPVIAAVPAELDMRQPAGARLGSNPGRWDVEELGDFRGVEETLGHHWVSPERGAYGIGLYSRLTFRQASLERFPRDGPVSVVARFDVGGEDFTLVLTHVHTPFAGDIHRRQFEALADARPRLGERLAVCGDLNSVPWSASFRYLASAGDLVDSHRGHWLDGSWPSWGALVRVPIDNCLISPSVAVLERAYGADVGSDHFPLIIRFGKVRDADAKRGETR